LEWLRKEGEKVKLAMAKAGRRVLYDPKGYGDWKDSLKVRKAWKLAWWDGYVLTRVHPVHAPMVHGLHTKGEKWL
jgi:hypothetical protein